MWKYPSTKADLDRGLFSLLISQTPPAMVSRHHPGALYCFRPCTSRLHNYLQYLYQIFFILRLVMFKSQKSQTISNQILKQIPSHFISFISQLLSASAHTALVPKMLYSASIFFSCSFRLEREVQKPGACVQRDAIDTAVCRPLQWPCLSWRVTLSHICP